MSMNKYLIVMDFLHLKYEIEYEENMSPQEVIRKVQQYLFPCEQNDDYFSSENKESINKFCLYRSKGPEFKGATFVTWNIKPEECDYKNYQFYLFRPFINVYLPIYVVLPEQKDKNQCKAYLELIYPIKKRVKLLKNYLKESLQNLTKDKKQFKDCPINGFSLKFISDSRELTDEEYIEQSMNGREIFLVINSENSISQNFYMPGRFYYIHYDPSSNRLSKETESLDETNGFTLDDTRKKLIRKHKEGNNFLEENVLITFNSVMQTEQFDKLDDLMCDNDFYKFVVIFETSEVNINPIPETFQYVEKRTYDIPIPKNGRPNIINFEITGEPKRELTQINFQNNNVESLNQPIEEINEEPSKNDDNINEISSPLSYNNNTIIEPNIENNSVQTDNSKDEAIKINNHQIIDNHYNREESIEPYIEEEEEENDNGDSETESEKEKLLDMFCFYFSKFSEEKQLFKKKTPNPTYFKNLSSDEKDLIRTFRKYYHFYRQSNH